MKIQVDPKLIPLIRASYTEEVAEKLGQIHPDQRLELEKMLKAIDAEEARAIRLYSVGKISDQVWDHIPA